MELPGSRNDRILELCTSFGMKTTTARRIAIAACLLWLAMVVFASLDTLTRWIAFANAQSLPGLAIGAGAGLILIGSCLLMQVGPAMPPTPRGAAE